MNLRNLVVAAVALASLLWATEALACQTCISVTITNPNTGEEKQTVVCYPSPCGAFHGGGVLKLPFSPNLRVKEGSACTARQKSESVRGTVRGHTCVLGGR
jgi:hypothetical protein